MDQSHQLPNPPRSSVDPRSEGMRTFDSHTGKSTPVTVDNQGHYVYASTIYFIIGVLLVGLLLVGWFLKRNRIPTP